ncbi:thermonuclease family protein [Leptothoe sp. EHU-05/26/07-4]
MKYIAILAPLIALAIVSSAEAHSGRTNASGCHNNRQTGGYHCHGGGSSSSGTPSNSTPSRHSPSRPSPDINSTPGNVIDLPGSSSETPSTQSAPQDELSRLADDLWDVVSVGDGDTMRVRSREGETITVRLACIDAPEMAQAPYGENARRKLQELVPVGISVSLNPVDTDRYGRIVAEVFVQNFNLNLSMVQSGAAVAYRQYLSNCNADLYLEFEEYARQYRLGVWSQANPVMPWDYRQQN